MAFSNEAGESLDGEADGEDSLNTTTAAKPLDVQDLGGQSYSSTTCVELPVGNQPPIKDSIHHHQNGKTVRRSASQTVLATITTVVKVNDERDSHRERSHARHPSLYRSSSGRKGHHTNNTAVSRVSLVPVIDEGTNSALVVSVGDDSDEADTPTASRRESEDEDVIPEDLVRSMTKERSRMQSIRRSIPDAAK
jgi:hypothetical protein